MFSSLLISHFSSCWNPPRRCNEAKVTQSPSTFEEDQLYFLGINTH